MPRRVTDKQRNNSEGRKRRLANLKPWSKGESGNPKGRPKSITLSEAYRRMLAQPLPDDPDRTFADAIAEVLCNEAVKGNVGAAREICDRTEGKARQALDVDMKVLDWRELAREHGITEDDVIREAQRLIESANATGGAESDREEERG